MSTSASAFESVAARATAFWFELSSWQRRWLLVAIGLLILVLAWSLIPRPPEYVVLFGGQTFDRKQQQLFEAAFAQAGRSDFEIRDGKLAVPKHERTAYMAALKEHQALPRGLGQGGLDEAGGLGIFQTFDERNRRAKAALCRDIAAVVQALPGVEDAFLRLDESTPKGFSREKHRSAMVAIRLEADQRATPQLIHTVQSIVASSQPGWQLADVTIVDVRSGRTYSRTAGSMQATDEYLAVKETYERSFCGKIEGHLAHIHGLRVTANVELHQRPRAAGAGMQWTPQAVTASLAVPESYLASRTEVVGGREQALQEIQTSALSVLPNPAAGGMRPTVTMATFDDQVHRPVGPSPTSLMLTSPVAIGMMVCFGLLGLIFVHAIINDFRRWRGGASTSPSAHDLPPPIPVADAAVEQPARVHERLTELVRENPRVAADTITEWVRKAG